jgi:hypothetical protein
VKALTPVFARESATCSRSLFVYERTQRPRKPSETLLADKARPFRDFRASDLNTGQELERILSHDKKSPAT